MPTPDLIQNRYQLVDTLGKGGMGVVYRAYDRLEQQHVALKQVLLPTSALDFGTKPGTNDTDKLRIGLAQEFSILATLRHPHILSVLDYGFDEQRNPFYTMTLLEGAQDVKSYSTNVSTGRRIQLLGQMLQALHYLHRRGVLHRDLKPDNVFVTHDGQIKVMDFGLAKQDKGQSSQSSTITGTIAYMAPEQFLGKRASVASDLFAVGVMVYEIMVGKHPFDAKTIRERIIKIMTHTPDFSPFRSEFAPWLERILEKDPSSRYATAYDALITFYDVTVGDTPPEDATIRESFLQANKFVGREIEFKQLTNALDTIDTQNSFFLIGGESGVGKSRLLDELRIQALVKGAAVLRGQAVEGGGLPFQLWRNILRRLLLMVEVTDLQAGILKDIVPDIDVLLQRDIATAPQLTDKAYQDRIVLTIVDLFRNLPQPVVLLLEDLQWAVESLAVLEQLLKIPEQLPELMVVSSYRDDEVPNLPNKLRGMRHIKLERLTPEAVSELSSAMLGDGGKNEAVVKLLHSQSEGNLFFLVETVRALAEESGQLERISQGELPTTVFTGGMQTIMQRRLQRVEARFHDIQTLAAVFGRQLDVRLLEHAFAAEHVEDWLINAAEFGVVDIQDNVWRFAHDKLRETLIVEISDVDISALHRKAAEAIETVYPDDAAYNEALLKHWQQVGDLEKMHQYLVPVAKDMLEIKGLYDIAEQYLRSMIDRLSVNDARAVILLNLLARTTERQGNLAESQQSAQRAFQLATSVNDSAGLAMSLYNLGVIAYIEGKYEYAFELHQKGLSTRKEIQDQQGIAESLNHMAIVVADQGDFDSALDLFEQSLVIQQERGDKRGIATSLNNIGTVSKLQGNIARARDLYQQSLTIKQELGDQRGIASNLINLADIQEDDVRAKELFQQSLALNQNLGDQRNIFYGFLGLAKIAFKHRDEQAASWYGQALRTAYGIQAIPQTLWAILGLTGFLLQSGQAKRAAQLTGLVQSHPAQNASGRNEVNKLMPLLEAALFRDELEAALEHGKSLDLDTVVQDLLAEFDENNQGKLAIPPSDDKRATVTAQAITENAAPSLDSVIAYAIAQLNDASVDAAMLSTEAARQKLSAEQIAELERKLAAKHDGADADATVNLQDIIDEVVVLLREKLDG